MEELDYDAQQRRDVFARYGLAMYQAQCVEKSLAILVSSVFNENFLPSEPANREEMQDDIFAKTTGALLTRLRKQVAVPQNLDKSLEEARRKRNWLAHGYFWDRAHDVLTTEGREGMIKELTQLSEFFSSLDAHLMTLCEKWARKVGIWGEVEEKLRVLIPHTDVTE